MFRQKKAKKKSQVLKFSPNLVVFLCPSTQGATLAAYLVKLSV